MPGFHLQPHPMLKSLLDDQKGFPFHHKIYIVLQTLRPRARPSTPHPAIHPRGGIFFEFGKGDTGHRRRKRIDVNQFALINTNILKTLALDKEKVKIRQYIGKL